MRMTNLKISNDRVHSSGRIWNPAKFGQLWWYDNKNPDLNCAHNLSFVINHLFPRFLFCLQTFEMQIDWSIWTRRNVSVNLFWFYEEFIFKRLTYTMKVCVIVQFFLQISHLLLATCQLVINVKNQVLIFFKKYLFKQVLLIYI